MSSINLSLVLSRIRITGFLLNVCNSTSSLFVEWNACKSK